MLSRERSAGTATPWIMSRPSAIRKSHSRRKGRSQPPSAVRHPTKRNQNCTAMISGGERSASFGTFASGAMFRTLDFGALAPRPAWGRVGPPFPVGEREGTTEDRSPGSSTSPSDSCSKSRTLFTHASVLQQPAVFSSRSKFE